jgi:uncharacterized protein YhaN
MKIDRLHLTAYGPFTERTLDFTASGVHVVLGPNEAGKSTTLAAISDALFGIPVQTKAGFVHDMKSLELGLDLRSDADATLSFHRLKKAKNDLRRGDDSVISATELAAFLGPIDRGVFSSMYGIDHDQLVAGGADLIAGRGELGQAIFGAGTGATNLHALMSQLEERAAAIFKPGGSQPTLNVALARYAAATKSAKEFSRRPSAYHELVSQLERLDALVAERQRGQTDRTTERELCRLLIAVLPNLRLRRRATATVADLEPGTRRLRTELSADLVDVHLTIDCARRDQGRLEAEIAELTDQIEAVRVDAKLLDQRAAISRLRQERGHIARDRADRPVLDAAARVAERAAEATIARLRPGLTLARAAVELAFETTATTRIVELAKQSVPLTLDLGSADNALGKTRREIDDHRVHLGQQAEPPDHRLLEAAVRTGRAAGDLPSRVEALKAEQRVIDAGASALLHQLALGHRPLIEVDDLAVPTVATVEQFRHDLQSAADKTRRLADRVTELTTDHARAATELKQLLATIETPSEDDLADRRAARDHQWVEVRSAWLQSSGPGPEGDSVDAAVEPTRLAEAFETAVVDADGVADRLRREADTVARRAHLEVEISELVDRIQRANLDLDQHQAEVAELDQLWVDQWSILGVMAATPADMTTWLADHGELKRHAREARRLVDELNTIDTAVKHHRDDLRGGLASVGIDPPAKTQLPTMLIRAETALHDLADARDARDHLRHDIERLTGDERKQDLARELAALAHQTWATDWAEAVARIGLATTTTTEEAEAVLKKATDLAGHLAVVTDKRDRLAEIDVYLDQQIAEIDALIVAVADDLVDRNELRALDALIERLDAAAEADATAQTHGEHRRQRQVHLAASSRDLDEAGERLQRYLDEAGATDEVALRDAIDRSDQLHRAEAELARLEAEIADQSEGRDVRSLELALADRDEIVLRATADQLDAELSVLGEQLGEANTELGAQRRELTEWDGSAAAADAAHDAQFALSEINTLTEEYLALHLAAAVLRDQIIAYRDEHQAPILQRAAPWFARLTCGAFVGLDTDLDDKGTPMLEAIRPNGDRVGVAGMSEGTCDQLYLALRLAALAEAATTQEPFPLVLDDLLMTFDDDRARAAFEILGELSGTFQVLLFTHHQHLLDLAIDALGDQLTHHQLDARDLTIATPSGP